MTERDLERVLKQSVQDIHLSDAARRNIRLATKEEKTVKSKKFAVVLVALVLALSISVGIAEELGMFDFLSRIMGQNVLPSADELVATDVASGETSFATYHIRQAAYDGKTVSIFAEIRPKDDHTLLMGDDCDPDTLYAVLINADEEVFETDSRTIAEYAAENGMTHLVNVGIELGDGTVAGIDEWQDNVITVLLSQNVEGDSVTLPLTYYAYDYGTQSNQRVEDEITLKAAGPLWSVSSRTAFDAPDFGIRVDRITITGTALQSYWTMDYTVTDLEKARDLGWNPDLLDAQGNRLPMGALGVGGGTMPQKIGDMLTYSDSFGPMQEAPEQLILLLRMWDEPAMNACFDLELK